MDAGARQLLTAGFRALGHDRGRAASIQARPLTSSANCSSNAPKSPARAPRPSGTDWPRWSSPSPSSACELPFRISAVPWPSACRGPVHRRSGSRRPCFTQSMQMNTASNQERSCTVRDKVFCSLVEPVRVTGIRTTRFKNAIGGYTEIRAPALDPPGSSRCLPAYPERASCKGNIGFEPFIEPGDWMCSDEVEAIADRFDERR